MNLKNKILDYIARYNFWYASAFIKIKRDYTFKIDLADTSSFSIELLKKYPGVIIKFQNLKMGEDGLLNFDTIIVNNPAKLNLDTKSFVKYTNRVLINVISESIKNAKESYDEDRENNFSELDEERAVHEESTAVPKNRVSKRKRRKNPV